MGYDFSGYANSSGVPLVTLSCIVSSFVLVQTLRHFTRGTRPSSEARYPPSPPSDPILGHARKIPTSYSHIALGKWYKTYGEIVLLNVLGSPMVVLNTLSATRELLEKKGANFSDRPRMTFLREWVGWDGALGFLPYGDVQRKQRRLIHHHLTPSAITAHHPTLYTLSEALVSNLRKTPDEFRSHIDDYIGRAVVMLTYGYEFTSSEDPRKLMIEDVVKVTAEPDMGFSLMLDLLPLLHRLPSWLPGMGLKRRAHATSKLREEMAQSFHNYVLESKAAGSPKPSLISQILDTLSQDDSVNDTEAEKLAKDIGSFMYLAGVETTSISLSTFFLAMAMYPKYVRRAQQELDAVTGGPNQRLPSFDDRPSLPYIDCILKEVLRWNPPIPLSIPHVSEKTDKYLDMTIPGESIVLPNIWFMCHDEDVYPSPMEFNPDRHLHLMNSSASANKAASRPDDPANIVFGFGRRSCSGLHYADASVWLVIATVLTCFDILPPLDPVTGEPVKLEARFMPTSTSHVEPFKCRIVPRK